LAVAIDDARASRVSEQEVCRLANAKIGSRSVDWFAVHEFVAQLLPSGGSWPAAGTPAWYALDDTDPRKLAAVLEAGVRWCLRIDTEQAQLAEASKDIAAIADWSAVARNMRRGRGSAYIPRRRTA
jgi:hypothetical protein